MPARATLHRLRRRPRRVVALAAILLSGLAAAPAARAADVLEEQAPLTVEQVVATGLEPLRAPRSLGFTGRPAWVRLRTENRTGEPVDRLLAWRWPLVERLEVHASDGHGGFTRSLGGLAVPLPQRALTHAAHDHLRLFRLAPGQTLDVYLRVVTRGPMLLEGAFLSAPATVAGAAATVLWTGLWTGAMGVLAATALWTFLGHRQRVYVDYALFGAAFSAYQLLMTGVVPSVLPALGPSAVALEPVLGALAAWTGVRLTRSYLVAGRLMPRADRVLGALAWVAVPAAAPALWGDALLANQLTALGGALAIGGCLVFAGLAAVRGDRAARDFLLGFGPFAGASGWFVATLRGQLPPSHTAEVASQATLLLSGLAVALALSAQRRQEEARNRQFLEAAVADRSRALDATVARLGAAQRLEAVGRLTAGVAHDFNNLLTAISAGADELLHEAPPGAPASPVLLEIRDLVRRGGELTRSLLTVARRQPLSPRPVALNLLVEELVRLLERLVKGVALGLDLDAGTGTVVADPGQLEQVVLNLVLNARDACQGRGRIVVATRRQARAEGEGGRPGGEWVRLTVQDDGPGMDEATRARVFEPFFTTKAEGKGTGLGLSVVDGVARAHGGFVEVASAPGQGATFSVWLPAAGAARQEQGPALTPAPGVVLTAPPRSVT
jgi:signal transduction histidine kinase